MYRSSKTPDIFLVFRARFIVRIGKLFLPLLDLPMRSTRMVPDRRMIWGGQDPAGYSLYTIEELCFLLEPLRLRGTVRDRSGVSFRGGGEKAAQGSAAEHTVECGMEGCTGKCRKMWAKCGGMRAKCGKDGKMPGSAGLWGLFKIAQKPPKKNSENARLF